MRIILTGATSFVGRAASSLLKKYGHELIEFRHSFDEEPDRLPASADVWLHFAWAGVGSVGRSDPSIQRFNVEMTMEALKKAAELQCARFLFAGSQAEYGHAQDGSLKTESKEAAPVSEYGKAKLEVLRKAEEYIADRKLPMAYIHMRLFSVYGPGDHESSLINTLIKGFSAKETVKLGPCAQQWNYMYIEDAARAIALLCERGEAGVINIAGEENRTLSAYVKEVHELLHSEGEIAFGERADNAEGPADLCADISRLKALGFAEEYTFEKGILLSIQKMRTMKAFVYSKKGVIELREVPAPSLDSRVEEDKRAAILKPRFISPCSSDVHTVFAGDGPRRENLILGHEGLAEIIAVGSEVKDFKPGELVAVAAVMPEPGDETGHMGMPFSGTKLGRNIDGMWAEEFKIPEADINLSHIPENVSTQAALMAVDMMATGYSAAAEGDIQPGQTVVVIGSGAVGLMAAAAAKTAVGEDGRVIIVGSDKDPVNAELAKEFGADIYLSYRDGKVVFGEEKADRSAFATRDKRANCTDSPVVDAVFACTGGYGADRVLICGGTDRSVAQASDMVRYGTGIVVNAAYIEGSGFIGLPIFSLGRGMSGKTFKFILSKGGRAWVDRMLMETGRQDNLQGKLVTHKLQGFEAIPDALALMHERPAGLVKIMVEI